MDTREIAKELAIACLSHAHFAATFRPVPAVEYEDVGERVGGFHNSIAKALKGDFGFIRVNKLKHRIQSGPLNKDIIGWS